MIRKGMKMVAVEGWLDDPGNLKEVKDYVDMMDEANCSIGSGWGCPDQEMQAYFPEDFDKDIPVEGCWILILKSPHCAIRIQKFSIWFAILAETGKMHNKYPIYRKLASIVTPDGELRIWPWEYSKIDINKYVNFLNIRPENSEPDMNIRFLSEDPKLSIKMRDMVFYMQARGISRGTAYLMLIEHIKDQNFCYFEMHESYVDFFTR